MQNESGIHPNDYRVLVLPSEVEQTTKGGLYLPDDHVEREKFGNTDGVLVAIGPLAFMYEDWPEGARKPQVGDTVMYAQYQASSRLGRDGKTYWIMNDKSIMATVDQ